MRNWDYCDRDDAINEAIELQRKLDEAEVGIDELLTACREARDLIEQGETKHTLAARDVLTAAIAKAEGGEP